MIGNYTYQGCYNDSTAARVLTSAKLYGTTANNMTLEKCATYCSQYAFWGVEYGQECYCGKTLALTSKNMTATDCKTPCPGNSTEYCGAGSRLSLYYFSTNSTTVTTTAAAQASPTAKIRRAKRAANIEAFMD
ncbi:hypothetical protein LTR16_011467, partial [Cryomyces antarcticus]